MKRIIPFLAFFISILLIGSFFPTIVKACSCAELPSVEQEFSRSKSVFSGKVVGIKEVRGKKGYRYKSVLFEVINTWKGVEQTQIIIATGQGGGDCGYGFKEGQEYLVYANKSNMYNEKLLETIICDRTNELSSSQEDLEKLGKGEPPTEVVDLTDEHEGNQLYIWLSVFGIVIGFVVIILLIRRNRDVS